MDLQANDAHYRNQGVFDGVLEDDSAFPSPSPAVGCNLAPPQLDERMIRIMAGREANTSAGKS